MPTNPAHPAKASKQRLDHRLCELSLAESASQAQRLIMAGLVYVDGQKLDMPGTRASAAVGIELRETLKYVSRGGLKLEKAMDAYPLNAQGAVCLDVGASTGGFTDVLLQRGAAKVYAVDVGHGQLHYRLQHDARVINLERTHAKDLSPAIIPEPVDAVVIDTSFISLARVLPPAWALLKSGGWCVALIKPQFEVGPKLLSKGVVRDEGARQEAVGRIVAMAKQLPGAEYVDVTESPIHGPKGNVEFLLILRRQP